MMLMYLHFPMSGVVASGVVALLLVGACVECPPPRPPPATGAPPPVLHTAPRTVVQSLLPSGIPTNDSEAPCRWTADVDHPLRHLQATASGGLVAIGPDRFSVLNPGGRVQWTRNLAQGDEVLASDDCIYLHLERENRVIGLGPQGQHQWHRPLAGQLTSLGQGALMATDAATARVITCDQGREQWIFAPDRVRNLRFLAVREDAIRLLGETGPQRTLYLLDLAGQPQGRLELPSQTASARSTQGGAVLARTATHLQALDQSGTQ